PPNIETDGVRCARAPSSFGVTCPSLGMAPRADAGADDAGGRAGWRSCRWLASRGPPCAADGAARRSSGIRLGRSRAVCAAMSRSVLRPSLQPCPSPVSVRSPWRPMNPRGIAANHLTPLTAADRHCSLGGYPQLRARPLGFFSALSLLAATAPRLDGAHAVLAVNVSKLSSLLRRERDGVSGSLCVGLGFEFCDCSCLWMHVFSFSRCSKLRLTPPPVRP